MAKVKDCPGFETFGADVKEARKAKNLARKDLAEKVNIDTRYLANIENEGTIPSLPVIIQLVLCQEKVQIKCNQFSLF
ncbi:helix-turn-helix domain-containing protein [Mediterraneibacter glycyrrhizinilyticus]